MSQIAANIALLFSNPLKRIQMEQITQETIRQHEPDIIKANQKQLQKGQRADGSGITPPYSRTTVRIKKKKGQPADKVTLKDKSDFYGGFYVKAGVKKSEISSTDAKTDALERKYGEDIFGLTVASKEQVAGRMRPTMQRKFKEQIR